MAHPEASLGMKIIELIKLININLNHFPKHEKYGLCQKIRQAVYDVFEMTVERMLILKNKLRRWQHEL